ncbi:glycosyltransferase family 4 protein [Candidatus Saccharibacteria bacterium]|nr:glycosyltransferase family 4 protein [Candidatus Saccharibacteria bacterium]
MTIGIDISALQSAHRMRGIGFTVLNFINHISDKDREKHRFVFFMFKSDLNNPVRLLKLDGMNYEIRYLTEKKLAQKTSPIGRLQRLIKSTIRQLGELKDRYIGSSITKDLKGIDVFIQPDQSQNLPRKWGLRKVLIVYDIIPYVLEWEYLWSYSTARTRGYSRKAALRCTARRWLYLKKLKINARRADLMLAISEQTKIDFINFVGASPKKIEITHLGVSPVEGDDEPPSLLRYEKTSWGYLAKPFKHDLGTPYLLYVGGADRRRKLEDLITAFNALRAEGVKIKLFLTGDTMQGPENIATEEIQGSLRSSSYLGDIVFLGFTDDKTRDWLYKHALAFVYPSTYEGFGLPVLEAMAHKCPVICYKNGAVVEVAGTVPLYTKRSVGIRKEVRSLLSSNNSKTKSLVENGASQAAKFSWSKTSNSIFQIIEKRS